MKAAIYRGIKNIEVVDLPMPTCDDNGIVVKNTYAAICGSDVAAYLHGGDDNMIWRDHEFGHEMATEVVSVGKNAAAQGIKEGDRLYIWGPFAKESMMRAATVGGFSEYMEIMNVGLNKTVFRIPDAMVVLLIFWIVIVKRLYTKRRLLISIHALFIFLLYFQKITRKLLFKKVC